MQHQFPFGEPLRRVQQTDRAPKKVFVLGVYASAVHARWIGPDDQQVVKALAVASEPYIFWRGEGAAEIIKQIAVPPELGRLEPADALFNGPSGLALDKLILQPLGLKRDQAWLCDLVPHSCLNNRQNKAIEDRYAPLAKELGMPAASIPRVPEILADDARRQEILAELRESQATTLILLGDQPIKWFLHGFAPQWQSLADFEPYGRLHPLEIEGLKLNVLPLAHLRQAAMLGQHSPEWYQAHQQWLAQASKRL